MATDARLYAPAVVVPPTGRVRNVEQLVLVLGWRGNDSEKEWVTEEQQLQSQEWMYVRLKSGRILYIDLVAGGGVWRAAGRAAAGGTACPRLCRSHAHSHGAHFACSASWRALRLSSTARQPCWPQTRV